MKVEVEFADYDDYDAMVNDLVVLAEDLMRHERNSEAYALVKMAARLLEGEIVEP